MRFLHDEEKGRYLAIAEYSPIGITTIVKIRSSFGIVKFGPGSFAIWDVDKNKILITYVLTEETAFKDYGEAKNFYISDDIRHDPTFGTLRISPTHLERFKISPVLTHEFVEKNIDKVYGIRFNMTLPGIDIVRANDGVGVTIFHVPTKESITDFGTIIDDSKVISFYTKMSFIPTISRIRPSSYIKLLAILVDDDTKVVLDKLIYIYTHIRDFLEKHNITLKDILEDIDLYVYVAAATAT
jgi:hypothetical protein